MTQWWQDFRDSVRYSGTHDISLMLIADSGRGTYPKKRFNCQTGCVQCTCSWTGLVPVWCVQMDRLSLVVTSEKNTEQYCYNNDRKYNSLTSCQFYLITIQAMLFNVARGYNCMEKVHVYETIPWTRQFRVSRKSTKRVSLKRKYGELKLHKLYCLTNNSSL